MNFITKLFNTSKIDCPRCLGKGHVDWADIARLHKELQWIPGKCAYCNGKGKVAPGLVTKVKVDTTYLTTNLSSEERQRILDRDEGALERASIYDEELNKFIRQIQYLHFKAHLDVHAIKDFYLLARSASEISAKEQEELVAYIEKVIQDKKQKDNLKA